MPVKGPRVLTFINLGLFINFTMDFKVLMIFSAFILKCGYSIPHVFSESYSYCEHEFSNGHKVVFPDKIWTIDNRNFVIYFSFCKSFQTKCRKQTSSCLINKSDNRVIDLGHEFIPVDSDELILESINGAKCPHSNRNYKMIVTFECSDTIKPKPRLHEDDECIFEITMMRPDCRPKCTDLIHNAHLVDVRIFPKNIMVGSESKNFSFSICGTNKKCGVRGIASCEIAENGPTPLATIDSQHVVYDGSKNELTARGRYKEGRVVRKFQVLIKCNWQVNIGGAKYIKPSTQGDNYKFEIESNFGCVKLPQNCALTSIDNLNYNLSNLNNPNGWQISNVPQGKILVNICGSLKQPKNLCSDQYSQVCDINNGNYINRGSILSSLTVDQDVVKAIFSSGSTCQENRQLLYSTEIEFHCSIREMGPVFKEFRECVMIVLWKTPQACPVDYYKSQNCYVNDRLGNRNLQKLYAENDAMYPLSPQNDVKLIYNLCGPIHASCDNFSNASFCLKNGRERDVVIGWNNKEVISDDGILKMEFTGNMCANRRSQARVTVHFFCNYATPSPPPQINIIEDGCKFDMKVFTHLACVSERTFPVCVHNEGNDCYDLSPLVRKDQNYYIPGDENLEYILNVCGPVVTGPGVLCKGNTMSCLRNKTEVNIKHKFTSLGVVSTPKMLNNSLVIESKMGTYCPEYGYYRTLIHFQCSQTRSSPRFLSKEPCTYNFIWSTPEACPIRRNCIVTDAKSERKLNLADLEEKLLKLNVENGTIKYEFDLCTDDYTKHVNDTSNKYPLKRDFHYKNEALYLTLDFLNEECDSNSAIKTVFFEFECDHRIKNYFEEKSYESCVLTLIMHTRMVCRSDKEKDSYSLEEVTTTSTPKTSVIPKTEKIIENNCIIKAGNSNYTFKMSRIKAKELIYKRDNYSLNFDITLSDCNGLICKNGKQILQADYCPITSFHHANRLIKLQYFTHSSCNRDDFFELEIWLKCSQTKPNESIIKNDTCKFILEYDLPEACQLFSNNTVPTSAIVGGTVGGILILGVIATLIYLNRRNCSTFRYLSYINLSTFPKTSVPIYTRDSTE